MLRGFLFALLMVVISGCGVRVPLVEPEAGEPRARLRVIESSAVGKFGGLLRAGIQEGICPSPDPLATRSGSFLHYGVLINKSNRDRSIGIPLFPANLDNITGWTERYIRAEEPISIHFRFYAWGNGSTLECSVGPYVFTPEENMDYEAIGFLDTKKRSCVLSIMRIVGGARVPVLTKHPESFCKK